MSLTHEQKEEITRLRLDGWGYRTIANKINATRDQVRDYCRNKTELTGYKAKRRETKRKCVGCGNVFSTTNNNQKYCSYQCRIDNYVATKRVYTKVKPECIVCGITIVNKSGNAKFCTDECKEKYHEVEKECLYCKKKFKTSNRMKKYCTSKCMGDDRKKSYKYETITCLTCGKDFKELKSSKAKYCSADCFYEKNKKKHFEFVKELCDLHDGYIVPLEIYENTDRVIKCKCLKCGNVMSKPAYQYIGNNARGCARCSNSSQSSKGSKIIEEYLIDNEIEYVKEYEFGDLLGVGGQPLRYDFALLEDNEVVTLIEYDGRQHFEPVWGGVEELKKTQEHDKRKNEYAKQKDIPLIRIKYTSKNIKKELESKINLIHTRPLGI